MTVSNVVVSDASNVAHLELSRSGKPKLANILAVRDALRERGFDTMVIADLSLWHKVDDADRFDNLVEKQEIRQVPAGTDAVFFILETADELNAQVVSNDQYKPFRERYPWIRVRRVPVMVIEGIAEIYEPGLEEPEAAGKGRG